MADIKTRDTVKGTIKTLDKAAIAGQKMKQAYIATKDKAEHSVNAKENTAEEYAADKTEAGIDEIAHKGAYAFNKAGRKGVQETKKNIQSAKDGIQRFKQQRAEKSINVQRTQYLYASKCRGGSIRPIDTTVCKTIWYSRICGID